MAVNHLNRVLAYYPMVQEGSEATVWLTSEDWGVVADMLFHMGPPEEFLPEAIKSFAHSEDKKAIVLTTDDCEIRLEPN